jgi:hypothetical protein
MSVENTQKSKMFQLYRIVLDYGQYMDLVY